MGLRGDTVQRQNNIRDEEEQRSDKKRVRLDCVRGMRCVIAHLPDPTESDSHVVHGLGLTVLCHQHTARKTAWQLCRGM